MSSANSAAEKDHPFFRHTDKATETPVPGTIVHGEIPSWLEGSLTRNGPGIQKVGNYQYKNLFDGLAILHKFDIKNGKATYQSRALESEAYKKNHDANRIVVSEFGTAAYPDPCKSVLGKLQAKFTEVMNMQRQGDMEMTDNCSVNVAYYGDQLYAMTETVFIRRIDPENLKSIGDKTRIKDYCALNTATAHPHCLEDGTILNVGNNFRHQKGPHYCFVTVPPAFNTDETAYKQAKIIAEIPSRWKFHPTYFHSFGMTTDKIIFIESPYCLDVPSIATAPILNNSFLDCLKWYSGEKVRFHVVSMKDGVAHPTTYESDAFFTFHHINAYEENGFIIVDVAAYNSAHFVKYALQQSMSDKGPDSLQGATARRYILPLNVQGVQAGENLIEMENTTATAVLRRGTTSTVDLTPHHLTKDWMELPRINYNYNGKKYNFAYAISSTEPVNYALPSSNQITKINVADGTTLNWVSNGKMVSEPVFVSDPSKPNQGEDDGVILTSVVHDDPNDVSLVILNAKDMTETSVVKFKADGAVTSTFHGLWAHKK